MEPENLELWDLTIPEMPPRSRLFQLEPFGAQTEMQESLLSYVVRLAREHCVRPIELIRSEILPLTNIRYFKYSGNFLACHSKTINSHAKYAREFCHAVQQLTIHDDLAILTFIPWGDVLDRTGLMMLHPHPKWCPACFENWRSQHVEPYTPLIWVSANTSVCNIHSCKLVDACPWCGKHQPFIPKHQYLDHCSHCGSSLVGPVGHTEAMMQDAGMRSEYERYAHDAIGEMIIESKASKYYASNSNFRERLKEAALMVADGSVAKFERILGFSETVIKQWVSNSCQPRIGQFLKLCYRLNTTPVKLLRDGPDPALFHFDKTFPRTRVNSRNFLSSKLLAELEIELEKILKNPHDHPSFKDVCKRLGYPITFLRYRFPELSLAISNKHKVFVRERSLSKKREEAAITKQVILDMLENDKLISNKLIQAELRKFGLSMVNPETRSVIKKTKEAFLKGV